MLKGRVRSARAITRRIPRPAQEDLSRIIEYRLKMYVTYNEVNVVS